METARDIVRAFNEQGLISKTIKVNDCAVNTVIRGPEGVGSKVLIEPWLPNFAKYNSNNGWKDESNKSMQALSHFSYEYSDGKYLICDLQASTGS